MQADKTKSAVMVDLQGYSTLVEPNLPRFTKEELASKLSEALKGVLEKNIANPPLLDVSVEEDDDDEISELSQSILSSNRPRKITEDLDTRRTIKPSKITDYFNKSFCEREGKYLFSYSYYLVI